MYPFFFRFFSHIGYYRILSRFSKRKILVQEVQLNFKEHEIFVKKKNQENVHSVDMRHENYDDPTEEIKRDLSDGCAFKKRRAS